MAAENEIVYEVTANTKSVEDSLKKVDSAAKDVAGGGGGFGKLDASITALGTAAIAAGAALATYLVGQGLSASIDAAIETEGALARMNNTLANMGRLSAESSADMQDFAAHVQRTTTVSDDATVSMLALATAFTRTNEQSKQVTMAAINMSAALGTSAESAIRQLGGTLNGNVGALARYIPELKNFTEEQLKAGKAVEYVASKFGGAAAAAANTYAGRIVQLKNAFGDLTEEIGFFFTKSKTLNFIFETTKNKVIEVAKELSLFRTNSGDIFEPLTRGVLTFAQYATITIFPFFEILNNVLTKVRETIVGTAGALYKFFTGDYGAAIRIGQETLENMANVSDIWQISGTMAAVDYLESFKEQITANAGLIQENLPEEMKGGPVIPSPVAEETVQQLDIMSYAYEGFFNKVKITSENLKKIYADHKKNLFATMVNGVQGAMNAVGQALVNGGNAFEAFGKAMLGMFGQLAMQLGMFYFLLGLATVYNDPARGAAMIAGGLALMVFGGVLQALAGGGGGAATGGATASSGGSGTAGAVGDSTVAQNETEDRQRATNIEVVVQGNVIGDKREFGLQVADAINEAFGNDGLVLARGAIS